MNQSAEYIPQAITAKFRSSSYFAWGITLALSIFWVLLIISPAIFAGFEMNSVADKLYRGFSFICHQMDDRSFHLLEHKFGVCARCFGVYFGLFAGFITFPLWRKIENTEPLSRFWLFLAMIPIGVDWTIGFLGIWENTHLSRFVTGLILGVACAVFLIPAISELAQLIIVKKFRNKSKGVSYETE